MSNTVEQLLNTGLKYVEHQVVSQYIARLAVICSLRGTRQSVLLVHLLDCSTVLLVVSVA